MKNTQWWTKTLMSNSALFFLWAVDAKWSVFCCCWNFSCPACFFYFFPAAPILTLWYTVRFEIVTQTMRPKKKEEVLSLWRETRQCVVSFSLSQWQSDVTRDFQQVRLSPSVVEKQLFNFWRSRFIFLEIMSVITLISITITSWEQSDGSITGQIC